MWYIIIILTLVLSLYKILKEYTWNTFNKQEGFLLYCLNSIPILRVQKFIFYFWIILFYLILLYILYIYFSIKILITFTLIIILGQKKYINILKITLKNVLKLLIIYSSKYLITYSDIIMYFSDSEPFKFLSYLFSLYPSVFTIYIVYKYFRDIYYAPQEQAELLEKLNTTIDKYKKESDNDNMFDKLKKEIENIIKEND